MLNDTLQISENIQIVQKISAKSIETFIQKSTELQYNIQIVKQCSEHQLYNYKKNTVTINSRDCSEIKTMYIQK